MWFKRKTDYKKTERNLEETVKALRVELAYKSRSLELYKQKLPMPLFSGVHLLTSDSTSEVDFDSAKVLFSFWYIGDTSMPRYYSSFTTEQLKKRLLIDMIKYWIAYYRTSNGNIVVAKGSEYGINSLEKIDEETMRHDYFYVVGRGSSLHMIEDNVHYKREMV